MRRRHSLYTLRAAEWTKKNSEAHAYVPPEGRLVALGTDGFGRSDKRAVLRKFFEVDSKSIVIAAIEALARAEMIEYSELTAALEQYEIDGDTPAPWTI